MSEGSEPCSDPPVTFLKCGDRLGVAMPADSGLYHVIVLPSLSELPRFREDLEGSFMEHALSCRPVAQALSNARRVGKFFGMLRWEGFFREACGPGWALVGDAGHFKEPTPGQGIQDAFRQVDALAPAIADALDDSAGDIDSALEAWGRWRDKDAAEHYWLATDMGKAGPMPTVLPEMQRRLLGQGKIDMVTNLFTHRSRPSHVVTPARLVGATGRLLARPGCERRKLLREVGTLIAEDVRRKRLNRRPVYATAGTALDAGPTEVDSGAVA
jgi:flavin-dependent dehydrogenase